MRGLFCRLAIFFIRAKNFFTLYLFYDRNEKFTTMEKYQLPPLPYSDSDLYPVISAETITFHYGKHTQGYIDKLNSLIAGTSYETLPLEDIIKTSDGALFNNAAQAWNHLFILPLSLRRHHMRPRASWQLLSTSNGVRLPASRNCLRPRLSLYSVRGGYGFVPTIMVGLPYCQRAMPEHLCCEA